MAIAAEAHYRKLGALDRLSGFVTAPHGTPEALGEIGPSVIEIVTARHPTPDEASQRAAERALALVAKAPGRAISCWFCCPAAPRRCGRRRRRA